MLWKGRIFRQGAQKTGYDHNSVLTSDFLETIISVQDSRQNPTIAS